MVHALSKFNIMSLDLLLRQTKIEQRETSLNASREKRKANNILKVLPYHCSKRTHGGRILLHFQYGNKIVIYLVCCNTHNMQLFRFAITRKHVSLFLSVFISFYNFVLSDIKFIEKRKGINDRHLSFSSIYVVLQYIYYMYYK